MTTRENSRPSTTNAGGTTATGSSSPWPTGPAVVLDGVSLTYERASTPSLRDVDLRIERGGLVVVIGRTGSGKSTLLGLLTGLVPHFTGGRMPGRAVIAGLDTATHRPGDLATSVGYVGQDPLAGFVTDTVEEELAYGMEQLGVAPDVMRRRVEETLDLLGIAELREAALRELSGGQQQRVAIGSVLVMHPQILVLDEPTSALDPTAAEDVLAILTRLVHDLGVTVVIAEHRIERVLPFADQVVHVGADGRVSAGEPPAVMRDADVTPPVVGLGRELGWSPLPLTIRDARRRLVTADVRVRESRLPHESAESDGARHASRRGAWSRGAQHGIAEAGPVLEARGIRVELADVRSVDGVDLTLAAGTVTVLMGRNGCGKSTLLWALQGSGHRDRGSVAVGPQRLDPRELTPGRRRAAVGLVPQTASDLLYLDSVREELAQADRDADAAPGTAADLLDSFAPGIDRDLHPRDLSEGQRLALVLAVQLAADPLVLLLDEPTLGLDYAGKEGLRRVLRSRADAGRAVLVATHDVEFAAHVADDIVLMAGGEFIATGPAREVLTSSPALAPQIAKICVPLDLMTLEEAVAALVAPSAPAAATPVPAEPDDGPNRRGMSE